jgi:hypothetical protein
MKALKAICRFHTGFDHIKNKNVNIDDFKMIIDKEVI